MAAWKGGQFGVGAAVMFIWLASSGIASIFDGVEIETGAKPRSWVRKRLYAIGVCVALGAARGDLVPFEKYAAAAEMLQSPSSAARALAAGVAYIERTDRLVQAIAAQKGMRNEIVDRTVAQVDAWLERNRRKAA